MSTPPFVMYCAGFMFSPEHDRVALIRKNKPWWQAGKLNAIGGKVEEGESSHRAMVREFCEETGMLTVTYDWRSFCAFEFTGGFVRFFTTIGDVDQLKTTTDEQVVIASPAWLDRYNTIPNLRWLIPMALDPGVWHGNIRINDP